MKLEERLKREEERLQLVMMNQFIIGLMIILAVALWGIVINLEVALTYGALLIAPAFVITALLLWLSYDMQRRHKAYLRFEDRKTDDHFLL